MRLLGSLILVLGTVVIALLVAPRGSTRAQETTGATPTSPQVTFAPVAESLTSSLGAAGAGLRLDWARLSPGASHVLPPDHPSPLLVALASGSLTVRSSAPFVVTRAASNAPGTGAQEEIAAGTEITLGPGEAFVRPPNSEQNLHNGGGEPAVALFASVASDLMEGNTSSGATPTQTGVVLALALVVPPQCPDGYTPGELGPLATPGGGGGGGGAGSVAVAVAVAPECTGGEAGMAVPPMGTPVP